MEDFSIFLPKECKEMVYNPTRIKKLWKRVCVLYPLKSENLLAGLNSRLRSFPFWISFRIELDIFAPIKSRITYLEHHEPCPWNEAGAFQGPHGAPVLRTEGCRSRRSPARPGWGSKLHPPIPTRQMQRASSIVQAQLLLLLDGIHSATMSLPIMKSRKITCLWCKQKFPCSDLKSCRPDRYYNPIDVKKVVLAN